MRTSKYFIVLFLLLSIVMICGMVYRNLMDISITEIEVDESACSGLSDIDKPVVYFGVISRFSPHIIYKGYQPVMDYLTETTPYQFKLRLSKSYDETVSQLVEGKVDAAFLGSYIYAEQRDKYHLESMLMPLNEDGEPYFHSAVVTRDSSSIRSIRDLAGKRLALPSQHSFSGNWLPGHELEQYGLSVNDLLNVQHFPYHHMVIHQILKGNFDAGVVKDRVAKEFTDKGIRIFALSEPVPGSPIVAGPKSSPEVIAAIKKALLAIDPSNPEFIERLKTWDIEFAYGFKLAGYDDYSPMAKFLNTSGGRQ